MIEIVEALEPVLNNGRELYNKEIMDNCVYCS